MNITLSKSELLLLKYLDNYKENDRIPDYFIHHHHLNVDECIEKFWNNELITYATAKETLKHYTVQDLKNILTDNKLSTIGNKSTIIERLICNVDENQLLKITDRYTTLTEKGKTLLKGLSENEWNNRFPQRTLTTKEERYSKAVSEIDRLQKMPIQFRYTIKTMKDQKVCGYCKSFEGKTFAMNEAVVGVNYPPFNNCTCIHNCRCYAAHNLL